MAPPRFDKIPVSSLPRKAQEILANGTADPEFRKQVKEHLDKQERVARAKRKAKRVTARNSRKRNRPKANRGRK